MIANQLPKTMLDEAANRHRCGEWLNRGDVPKAWPLNDRGAIEALRAVEYDATPERAERFATQTPEVAPELRDGKRRWTATSLVGFASWLECRRLWLAGDVHKAKKSACELEAESGAEITDMDSFAAEDIVRLLTIEPDINVRLGLMIALETKLELR
jgi:hypothetical protein